MASELAGNINGDRVDDDPSGYWLMRGHPGHTIAVPKDGRWSWNGDRVRPTFSPSVHESPGSSDGHHFFVRDGIVQYLADKRNNPCCAGCSEYWAIPAWDE